MAKKKPAKKAAKKPAKKAAKKATKKKPAKKATANCKTVTICKNKRKLCWGNKKGPDGVTRRVIVSNVPG